MWWLKKELAEVRVETGRQNLCGTPNLETMQACVTCKSVFLKSALKAVLFKSPDKFLGSYVMESYCPECAPRYDVVVFRLGAPTEYFMAKDIRVDVFGKIIDDKIISLVGKKKQSVNKVG